MKKLKGLWLVIGVIIWVSCSMAAKTEKKETKEVKKSEAGEVIALDKATFLKDVYNYEKDPTTWVYEGKKPCIIDFYADWCGPCKQVAPILKEMAAKYKDQIIVYKIDVDKETELAGTFGIRSIPTILFVPMEGKPQLVQGAMPKNEIVKQIESYLLNNK
ncbi:thioredoxin [Parabacteroides pacaensis]|uniref:thioredoxin n=1 Tax=Parabacteroides pacaensis TaxID=2086575 RepID=UPI000D10F1B4|nr:thioredoxin [Parabacteroides pacaensis]